MTDGCFIALLVYVDEIVIAGNNQARIDKLKKFLDSHFKLKDLGDLKYFLGLEVARSSKGIMLSQHHYVLQLTFGCWISWLQNQKHAYGSECEIVTR